MSIRAAAGVVLLLPVTVVADEPAKGLFQTVRQTLRRGRLRAALRYRYESFDREGPALPHASRASTLRNETTSAYGFSGFAELESVLGLGALDYSVPTVPSRNKQGYPAILDPPGADLNQAYLKWKREQDRWNFSIKAGRQEIMLNDGRFVSTSSWRQNHQSFDAARFEAGRGESLTFSYAFLDRFHRVVGHGASDGRPKMNSHLLDLAWKRTGRVNVSIYSLLVDYQDPAQSALSTSTIGARASGPYVLNRHWSILYAAELARQRNSGRNPNHVNAGYSLGEVGAAYKNMGIMAGYSLLGGKSATNKLSAPLAHPLNGWTELFAANPSVGAGHGLEARRLSATGLFPGASGLMFTATYYDYHSDSSRLHYGREMDLALACKLKRTRDRWEIGWRFGRYWADRLYTGALRTSVYTSVSF